MGVDFCTKIKFGGHLASRAFWPQRRIWRDIFLLRCRRKPCWARISENGSRKILFSKNLDTKILITKDFGWPDSISLDRHCLDHDGATSMASARADVTRGLWKSLGCVRSLSSDRPYESVAQLARCGLFARTLISLEHFGLGAPLPFPALRDERGLRLL